jgi:hypothetical protein
MSPNTRPPSGRLSSSGGFLTGDEPYRFVVHDRDAVFSPALDDLSCGVHEKSDIGVTTLELENRGSRPEALLRITVSSAFSSIPARRATRRARLQSRA